MKISDWRSKIDAVDTTMLHLLNLRAKFALEVGRLKGQEGLSLRTPARERAILSRMKELNPGPLDGKSVEKIYEMILRQCIRTQGLAGFGNAGPSRRGRRQGKQRKAAGK